ncbi:MAG: JDVT-CTERM system CAAX-type protease [Thiotrichales bacterium]|nr:MAG: JDVT-CTERM system CAAX-type protease [Thiotrichales bacterium]
MPDLPETDKHRNSDPGTIPAWRKFAVVLLHEAGLMRAPRCFSDYRFLLAIAAGIFALWAIHDMMPPFSSSFEFHWKMWLSLVIWQPIVEEILFRGILQGQLIKTKWGPRSLLNISAANGVTSILFAGIHMINNSPVFALTVFAPSLLFGYFRDRCNSIYPSILLHSAFNALVIDGLFIHGNMIMP